MPWRQGREIMIELRTSSVDCAATEWTPASAAVATASVRSSISDGKCAGKEQNQG